MDPEVAEARRKRRLERMREKGLKKDNMELTEPQTESQKESENEKDQNKEDEKKEDENEEKEKTVIKESITPQEQTGKEVLTQSKFPLVRSSYLSRLKYVPLIVSFIMGWIAPNYGFMIIMITDLVVHGLLIMNFRTNVAMQLLSWITGLYRNRIVFYFALILIGRFFGSLFF